ncbi:2-amino-4-hydroxy-6-hydroxymethyldihydropteridine diphosphokinase [Acinetobacter sp. ANC 4648]|uniref:2-amino-4-hydroxy-6- hydroxymethyldihydropteridine diphosphokinase n=1 Tax=Acinetobacter sp. ANC 4648 TaxID=1977875 RepID=UPI000A33CC8D|nr:2-amino-4-hydroxy-6-hydroxymethyldihydropteridine diphosphokinase [Acinetobacter sp. ANC 4648]OTG83041.1 2-amino-4-hydroxy-6-hydroxymethyldihydropteridine pyrophosphokinase [Acinetobacter sp. ANC 4648]
MNATETIFALALASNCHPKQNFQTAIAQISTLGDVIFSHIYLIPCRDGVGTDYWNSACLLKSHLTVNEIMTLLKQMEADSGRVRPSHQITLDADLIAWGSDLAKMQFNPKKIPLALDVKIPMLDIWKDPKFGHVEHQFPIVSCDARVG